MKLHLRTAADDGVWLCCVGCFQNSSPQTSLVISLRKLQPDLPALFTSSVFLGKDSGFRGPFLDLVLGGPSLGTSAFLDDGQIVALCNSPLPFNLVLFELGAPRGDTDRNPCLWLCAAREARAGAGRSQPGHLAHQVGLPNRMAGVPIS